MNDYENSKRLRVAELLLVLSVAFAPTLFISIYLWFTHAGTDDQRDVPARMLYGLISELTAIAVLTYVLFRQGRSLSQIGFVFSWKDVPVSLVLAGLAFLASTVSESHQSYSRISILTSWRLRLRRSSSLARAGNAVTSRGHRRSSSIHFRHNFKMSGPRLRFEFKS